MPTKNKGKLASKSASSRVANVRAATQKVSAKTTINFARSIRGK